MTIDTDRLTSAVGVFAATFRTTEGFGPDALPAAMGCGEANAMVDLLEALGLAGLAADLQQWHLASEGDEEATEEHPHWAEEDEQQHRDVTPRPQPYRDGMFVSVCSCGAEFLGDDPDDADYRLDCHVLGDHPCGCPSDVITSPLRDGGEQCSRCGSTWDREDRIITRRGEDLPRVGRREHA